MRRRYIPVAYKLAFAIAVITIGCMSGLTLFVVQSERAALDRQLQGFGETIIRQLSETAKEPLLADDQLGLEVLVSNLNELDNVLGVAVFDRATRVKASSGLMPFAQGLEPAQEWQKRFDGDNHFIDWQSKDGSGRPVQVLSLLAPVEFRDLRTGYVLLNLDRTGIDDAVEQAIQAIISATLAIIGLGTVVSLWAGRRLSRPIKDLVAAKAAIDEGRYQVRIDERRRDEIGDLIEAFNDMAEGLLQKRQVEMALSRYVSNNVAQTVLQNLSSVSLGGQHVKASVLFADIVGFTALAETLKPKAVAHLLNEYFGYISHATALYGGVVDKYIGDCAMLLFGVPEHDEAHALHAVSCAMLIQRIVDNLVVDRANRQQPAVRFRMGVNTGMMLAGNLGSTDRMQFTVVGDAVNLAARFCTYADPGAIVLSQDTVADPRVRERFEIMEHKAVRVRGKQTPVAVYQLLRCSPEFDVTLARQANDILGAQGLSQL